MGRSPCCDETGLKKGPWTPEEDQRLVKYIQKHGHGSWRALPRLAGLNRCGKSCRLRWTNYLRPDIKRGKFSQEEEQTILNLHSVLGNKWSAIASHLPGRTDNEIKNFWNTHLKKKLIQMGFDPMTHRPRADIFSSLPHLLALANLKELMDHPSWEEHAARLQAEAVQMARLQYLQFLFQPLPANGNTPTSTFTDMETINLLNSISSNSIKDGYSVLGSVHFESPNGSSSLGGTTSANLQSIHDSVLFSHLPDLLQIPCTTSTTTNGTISPPQTPVVMNKINNSNMVQGPESTPLMISHGGSENSPNSPWFPSPSPTCLTSPPTRNTSISNLVDACSTSSYGEVAPSVWPDLLLDDSLFHEMA